MRDAGCSHLCLTQRVAGELPQPQARAAQRHVEVRAGQEAPLSGRPIQPVCVAAHRLRQWLRRYICCNGDCPCSGRMSEQSCPEFCLCAEVSSSLAAGCSAWCLRGTVLQLCVVPSLACLPPQSMHRARLPPHHAVRCPQALALPPDSGLPSRQSPQRVIAAGLLLLHAVRGLHALDDPGASQGRPGLAVLAATACAS